MNDPRVIVRGETVKVYYPPIWDLYPFEEAPGYGIWPIYPYGENWSGWDRIQPEHVHRWIDITAIDDPQFQDMCSVCGEVRRSDR